MAETTAPEAVQAPVPTPPAGKSIKKKKQRRKIVKRIISIILILAILGGIGYGLARLFHKEETEKSIWSDMLYYGSIQTSVTGYGVTKPRSSTTVTLQAAGTYTDVYVFEGDWVEEGDLLFHIDSPALLTALENANLAVEERMAVVTERLETVAAREKDVEAAQKALQDVYDLQIEENSRSRLTAPFSGQLQQVSGIRVGDYVTEGMEVARLVDDHTMLLHLYFSYAYENAISVGQKAMISLPASMRVVEGKVDSIAKTRRVTPEGGVLFEVTLSFTNPGTIAGGVAATAWLTDKNGTEMYPYEAGQTEFSRIEPITAPISGKVTSVTMLDYLDVKAGQTLMVQTPRDYTEELKLAEANITAAEKEVELAQEAVAAAREAVAEAQEAAQKAQEALDSQDARAPISGTILGCSAMPGATAEIGTAAVSIADTSVMLVDVSIDGMNISYVKPGMPVTVTQWGRDGQQYYFGTVSTVSMEGSFSGGMSTFPATLTVENPDGTLMSGNYIDFEMAASQSDWCLLAPVQAVKYTTAGTCLFVQADSAPENAISAEELGVEVPEGYYAIPVTVGLSDNNVAEIVSGAEEGMVVFIQYMTNQGSSWSDYGVYY